MRRIGLLTEQGLAATRAVWAGVVVVDTMHWSDLHPLNVAVLKSLALLLRRTYAAEEERQALRDDAEHWIFPLTPGKRVLANLSED